MFNFEILLTLAPLLISITFFTLAERKVIGTAQRRKGSNNVFFWGLLQPFADALKAILKELIFPKRVDFFLFLLAPLLTFFFSLLSWFFIPLSWDVTLVDYNLSFIFFLGIASLGFYGVLLASWASNSKYAFLGAFRAVAQIVSYEIFLALTILPVIAFSGSWNFIDLVFNQKTVWNTFIFPALNVIFFISLLAETNRIPFDLPEAEAEIVAGYNIEYSGFIFALFFLGEYSNMLVNAFIIVLLFWGGWLPVFFNFLYFLENFFLSLKVVIFCFFWIFIRATLPRYRYDQMMDLGWKALLPITLTFFYFFICMGVYFNSFPFTNQL